MSYLLENVKETERLQRQSTQSGYLIEKELIWLDIPENGHLLDAGCGSGLAARYISQRYPWTSIKACDASDMRLQQAKSLTPRPQYKSIEYIKASLEELPFADESFDIVLCRYVYEYLGDPDAVTAEFHRILRPGGVVCLIDVDGVFLNLHSRNRKLKDYLKKLERELSVDLYVGRKLIGFLHRCGFKNITSHLSAHQFRGDDLQEEYINNETRCVLARHEFVKIFNGESAADEFIRLYLEEMKKPENMLFHNKFIAIGTK